ncbi:MAG: type II toxin-antitoxin system RelE/ParE family toxin [bacterium]
MNVFWTKPAAARLYKLPRAVQRAILDRITMISEFPEMYPVRTHQPFAGLRYFFVRDWCVSYATADDALIILAVFHA